MNQPLLVLYNDEYNLSHGEEIDSIATGEVKEVAKAIEAALQSKGFHVLRKAAPTDPAQFISLLRELDPNVVFNLVESLSGVAKYEAAAAWIYELMGIHYTGSGPTAMTLALEKPITRHVLQGLGLPIPHGCVLTHRDDPMPKFSPPLIVKPSREDASTGISIESVVESESAARERAHFIHERYHQPALIEEFIDGRELNISILETLGEDKTKNGCGHLMVLPFGEIDFSGFPKGLPKLVTYKAKWFEESDECIGTKSIPAESLSEELFQTITQLAKAAFTGIGLRDYGRIDFRLHPTRGPFILDVNANPDLSPDAGLARAAQRKGIPYAEFISIIVQNALSRKARASSPSS